MAFDGGRREVNHDAAAAHEWQVIAFPHRRTTSVRFAIDATAPGKRWPNDVAVPEIRIIAAQP
jgi:hypothetical protein